MKPIIFAAAMLCGTTVNASAAWSLDSCVTYAATHSIQVRQRLADIDRSRLDITSAKNGYLPQIDANASQGWNIGRGLTASNTYADRNTTNTQWGVSLSLPIFDGLATPRQKAYAEANLVASLHQLDAAKDNVTLNVIASYLQVLYQKELHREALHQADLSTYELSRRKALLEAGKIPEIDLLEAESQLASDQLNVATTDNDTRLALVSLAQLLNLESVEGFDVEDVDSTATTSPLAPLSELTTRALERSYAIKAARAGITAADRNIDLARTGYLPKVSFQAGLGSSYYTVNGMDNESFGTQMKNNYSTSFGVGISVPIFDAKRTSTQVKQAKVQRLNAELQLDQAEQDLLNQVEQAYWQADGARRRLEAADISRNAALKAFEAMTEKYSVGRATPTDYEQSKSKALTATTQALHARYELILRTRILNHLTNPGLTPQ